MHSSPVRWQQRPAAGAPGCTAQRPQAFADNALVKSALQEHGNDCLPLVLLDGAIVSQGRYPSRDELARLAGVEADQTADATTGASSPNALKLPVINKCC